MSVDEPFARLPEAITLPRAEVAVLFEALDVGEARTTSGSDARRSIESAKVLLIRKLWPEAGEAFDEGA